MINDFYLYTFFASAFILYLIINDIKKIKPRLYNLVDYKIWIKLYVLILLFFIHGTWLFFTVFSSEETKKDIIYGLPPFLIIPYLLYLFIEIQNNKHLEKNPQKKIIYYKLDKYLNFITSFYILFIIFITIIPNHVKICIIESIIKCFMNY